VLGITLLAAALSRFFLVEMTRAEQALCVVAALLMIAPGCCPRWSAGAGHAGGAAAAGGVAPGAPAT
jgi:TRAP-type uncharacterized transport system fused permease subunit